MNGYRRGGGGFLFIILYLIFGAYFINYPFNFLKLPSAIDPFNKWIILVGGILIIIGAINQLRLNRYTRYTGY
ncbi:MAG: hypothetical protein AABX79_02355 [Nanoarchaeota archaeon]